MSFRSRWQLWSALRPGGGRPQWPRNSFRSSRRWQHWQGGGGGGQATAGAGASAPRANVNACTHGEGTRRVGCCAPTARTRAYASLRKTRRARPARTVCSGAPVPMQSHCAIWCGSPRYARRGRVSAGREACLPLSRNADLGQDSARTAAQQPTGMWAGGHANGAFRTSAT